jgi:hypothetical protein
VLFLQFISVSYPFTDILPQLVGGVPAEHFLLSATSGYRK